MIGPSSPHDGDARRIVVIDAGKSTVRAAVFVGERVLARHRDDEGFPHPGAPGARELGLELVGRALHSLGGAPYDLVVLAATGIRTIGAAERSLRTSLTEHLGCEVIVANDVVAAYLGAFGPSSGVLVQAGTGSLVLGVADGRPPVHLDGWGHLAGDRGSGFALGRAGLRAACSALDGTGADTELARHLAGPDPEQVIRDLYSSVSPVKDVAALAPTVLRTAAAGDRAALDVVTTIAQELAAMIRTAARRLGDPHLEVLPVAGVGGLFADRLFADTVTAQLREHCPGAEVRESAGDALEGGRLLATAREHPITRLLTTACRNEDA